MKLATQPIILPHCHLYAKFFPDDFKGKIVHITRDQSKGLHQISFMSHDSFDKLDEDPRKRAIIASAYPFLKQFPNYTDFFETWNFQSLNDFALHDVQGTVFLSSSKLTVLKRSETVIVYRLR